MKYLVLIILLFFISVVRSIAQTEFDKSKIFQYQKKELDWGAVYDGNSEREELRTEDSREYEELNTGAVKFQFKNQYWNFLEHKQEQIHFNFELGPLWGTGNWIDSSHVENITADHDILGLRTQGIVAYTSRYYYSNKSFTLVQLNARIRYDIYRQNSEGMSTDSVGVSTEINEKTNVSKLRYGFLAKAGWGIGRLNPVNHFMVADFLMNKYYKGRNFSHDEIVKLADEISEIKHRRDIITGHDAENESEQIQQYLNKKLFLTLPEDLYNEWIYGEFLPRYNGSKFEFGPFFTYYNQEPDFIYGGYLLYENAKYCNFKWNRNIKGGINYNRYKHHDWVLAELDLGWSYFVKLKSQFDFGLKYIPGVQLNNLSDVGKLNHGFIPYVSYYSQINSKTRINLAFALRISEDESLMLPGPEFSLLVYRSRY